MVQLILSSRFSRREKKERGETIVKSRLSVLSSPSLTSMQENRQIETLSLSLYPPPIHDKLIIISRRVDLYLEQNRSRRNTEIIGTRCLCPVVSRGRKGDRVEVVKLIPAQKGKKEKGGKATDESGGSRFVKVKSKQSLRSPGR